MPIVPDSTPETFPLPAIPAWALGVLAGCLAPILAWVSALVAHQVLRRCADHPLVRLQQTFAVQPLVAACQGFHHAPGRPGRPPTYTVEQFVRMEMVRAFLGRCSDPALEQALARDLLLRWFVGLPLLGSSPDHSTLAAFHAWLTTHAPDAFFRASLTFLDQVDPEDPATTPQIVDTFAMASPAAASPTTAHLLHHLTQRLVRTVERRAPTLLQPPALAADRRALAARLPSARTPDARQQRLQTVVNRAQRLVTSLTAALPTLDESHQNAIRVSLDALTKVQADDLMMDADGQVRERTTHAHGAYRLASAMDVEATFRKHGSDPAVLGSNAVISTTATRIRAATILTGATPDSEAPVAVLRQQQEATQALPKQLVMDQAGGWGKTRAEVDAVSDGKTQMVAQVPSSGGSDPNRFTVAQFQVDADRTTCTCPHGVVSTRAYAHGDSAGVTFRFLASQCRDCPLRAACRDPQAKPTSHRTVFISDYHAYVRAGQAFTSSPPGKALLRERWRVEPTIAWLVRYQGCRAARRVGRAAAHCQLFQACGIRNLLGWVTRVQRGTAPPLAGAP